MVKPTTGGAAVSSAQRYAHPYFLPQGAAALAAAPSITDWSKLQLGPLPPVKQGGVADLAAIIGEPGVREIEALGEIRIHALGDTGVGHADAAQEVAEEMATDFKNSAGALNPAFLFHLGDVVYGVDKGNHYGERFYSPYRHYPGKIIAIPGNHDGEVRSPADDPSLGAFLSNFCAPAAVVPAQASASGIFRETMTLPGAYWMLDCPFVRIVGLYSNRLENPGYLQGKDTTGAIDRRQIQWLQDTLSSIAAKKDEKALLIATHHPPFSTADLGGHSGSKELSDTIDGVCRTAGIWPHMILSGHSHNYQRYVRRIEGRQIPYIVAGTGGMPPQPVPPATGQPAGTSHQTTYDAAIRSLGYLFLTVSESQVRSEFWQLGVQHTTAYDPFTVDLKSRRII